MKTWGKPEYISKSNFRSLGNEYRIYMDRIELEAKFLFQTIIIPGDDLISIEVYSLPVIKTKLWALKIDWADFNKHVGIERKSGWMKNIRFTPRNPQEFVEKAKEIFKQTDQTN